MEWNSMEHLAENRLFLLESSNSFLFALDFSLITMALLDKLRCILKNSETSPISEHKPTYIRNI